MQQSPVTVFAIVIIYKLTILFSFAVQDRIIEHKTEPKFTYRDPKGVLACSVELASGRPLAKYNITWFKNNTPVNSLDQGERFFVAKNDSLIIDKPKRSDSGVYTALITGMGVNFPNDYECLVQYFAEPLVLDFPRSINLEEGETLDLKCQVKGYPQENVTWYRNGRNIMDVLKNSFRLQMKELDGYDYAHLILKSLRRDDQGIYKCVANSVFFNTSNSKELLVRVKDRMAFLWPLLGITGSFILLCLLIVAFESTKEKDSSEPLVP